MKGNLCKILLAVSFLFLMPNLCMSQNLKGIWRLVQNDATSQVTRYKVLDKEGKFYNVDVLRSRKQRYGKRILSL